MDRFDHASLRAAWGSAMVMIWSRILHAQLKTRGSRPGGRRPPWRSLATDSPAGSGRPGGGQKDSLGADGWPKEAKKRLFWRVSSHRDVKTHCGLADGNLRRVNSDCELGHRRLPAVNSDCGLAGGKLRRINSDCELGHRSFLPVNSQSDFSHKSLPTGTTNQQSATRSLQNGDLHSEPFRW